MVQTKYDPTRSTQQIAARIRTAIKKKLPEISATVRVSRGMLIVTIWLAPEPGDREEPYLIRVQALAGRFVPGGFAEPLLVVVDAGGQPSHAEMLTESL